ncbi:MAG TPA: hypothetical protein VMU51_11385 [Mycobacteriales bacterium]|nr:hypothetical protein [Mycobacteriales bacterium]
MIDTSWFRDRVDAELGDTPGSAEDRLQAVTTRLGSPARRRIVELSAAGSVLLVTLVLVLLTAAIGPGRALLGGNFPDPPGDPSPVGSQLPNLPPVTAPAGLPNLPSDGGGPVPTSYLGGPPSGGPRLGGTPVGTTAGGGPGSGPTTTPPAGGPTVTTGPGPTTPPRTTATQTTTPPPPPTTTEPPPPTSDPPTPTITTTEPPPAAP